LSEAFKDHEKEKRKEQLKAEDADIKKKRSSYNADIEIVG
jgi:hypothetical protein